MEWSGPAESDQHKLPWVMAASDRYGPNGAGHVVIDDLHDAGRGFVDTETQRARDPCMNRLPCSLAIERDLPT
jgi:hypothetical protein